MLSKNLCEVSQCPEKAPALLYPLCLLLLLPDAGATELLAAGGTLDGAPGGGRAGAVQRTHHRHRDHVQVVSVLGSSG